MKMIKARAEAWSRAVRSAGYKKARVYAFRHTEAGTVDLVLISADGCRTMIGTREIVASYVDDVTVRMFTPEEALAAIKAAPKSSAEFDFPFLLGAEVPEDRKIEVQNLLFERWAPLFDRDGIHVRAHDAAVWSGLVDHAAKQASRFAFRAVQLEAGPDGIARGIATDGKRLLLAEGENFHVSTWPGETVLDSSTMVPAGVIKAAIAGMIKTKAAADSVTVSFSQDSEGPAREFILVRTDHVVVFCLKENGCFPKWRQVVPDDRNRVELEIGAEELGRMIDEIKPAAEVQRSRSPGNLTGPAGIFLLDDRGVLHAGFSRPSVDPVPGRKDNRGLTRESRTVEFLTSSNVKVPGWSSVNSGAFGVCLDYVTAAMKTIARSGGSMKISLPSTEPSINPLVVKGPGICSVIMPVTANYAGEMPA